MKFSAVLVSRLDHPIGEVVDSIAPHVEELIIVRGHGGVVERWSASGRCLSPAVYVADDDAIVDVPAVLAAYEPGKVVCNMPQDHRRDYPDGIALVGWGCVFDTYNWHVPFTRYMAEFAHDALFDRECDRVFTGLSDLKLIDVPVRHLPQAHGADRMGREARHGADLKEIRRRIYAIRNAK